MGGAEGGEHYFLFSERCRAETLNRLDKEANPLTILIAGSYKFPTRFLIYFRGHFSPDLERRTVIGGQREEAELERTRKRIRETARVRYGAKWRAAEKGGEANRR